MKKLLCCLMACIMLTGCSTVSANDLTSSVSSQEIAVQELDDDFRTHQMQFALTLFQETCAEHQNENVLVSPLSVMLALSMTANGADGETKSQMESVLESDITALNQNLYSYVQKLPSGRKAKLSVANSIWFKDEDGFTIKPEFLQSSADYYHAGIYQEDFSQETCDTINNWVRKKTDNSIDTIISEINPHDMMYLINALAFDAKWRKPYQKKDIREQSFINSNGEIRNIDMMYSKETYYLESEQATGFIKGYEKDYCFAALLPNQDISIDDYITSLNAEAVFAMFDNGISICPEEISAGLPEFKGEFSTSLKETFQNIGMTDAFTEEADFSNIAEYPLRIDDIFHETYIEVNAQGTKATAATKITLSKNGDAIMKSVILDRPFVYMILDGENKLPIFIGTIKDIKR